MASSGKQGIPIQGQKSSVAIAEILAAIEESGRSAEVRIAVSSLGAGTVWFRNGRMVDARMGPLEGESACLALLAMKVGVCDVEHCPVDRPATIRATLSELRRRMPRGSSSWARLVGTSTGFGTVLSLNESVYADFKWVMRPHERALIDLVDGQRTVLDVVACSGRNPVTALAQLITLSEAGLFTAASSKPGGPERAPKQAALEAHVTFPIEQRSSPGSQQPAPRRLSSFPPPVSPRDADCGGLYSVRPEAVEVVKSPKGSVPPNASEVRMQRTATLIGPGQPDDVERIKRIQGIEVRGSQSVVPQRCIPVDNTTATPDRDSSTPRLRDSSTPRLLGAGDTSGQSLADHIPEGDPAASVEASGGGTAPTALLAPPAEAGSEGEGPVGIRLGLPAHDLVDADHGNLEAEEDARGVTALVRRGPDSQDPARYFYYVEPESSAPPSSRGVLPTDKQSPARSRARRRLLYATLAAIVLAAIVAATILVRRHNAKSALAPGRALPNSNVVIAGCAAHGVAVQHPSRVLPFPWRVPG